MENFYRVRKVLVCILFIVFGLWFLDAMAEYVELKNSDVLGQSRCAHNGKPYVCVVVKLDETIYVVIFDAKGEHSIYQVIGDESVLIWYRDSV